MQTRDVRRLLQRVGMSYSDASAIAERVIFQIRSQGPENTARFLKAVGDTALWAEFGTGVKAQWVHTRHRWPVFLAELRHYPSDVKVRVVKLARCIRLPVATKKQLAKVVDGAIRPFEGEESAVQEMSRFINLGLSRLGLVPKPQVASNHILIGRQFSKVMSVSGPVANTSAPPILESFRILKAFPELTALPEWYGAFAPLTPKSCIAVLDAVDPLPRVCGEIHGTQEGGAKLRMYASPYTAIQCVMSPVHDWFADMLRQLPMNCTWDQLRGATNAQAKLKEGTVFSLDLSTATCRFPLSVQTAMATTLGLSREWIVAIEAISRGRWLVGSELDRRRPYLAWSTGQPLGMRFSMSMFSLAHNLLIAGIASDLGFNPWDAYNVLGDDVVIYHEAVARVYSQLVQVAGIPISWNKSHESDRIAEFAGATITKDLVIRPGQFREAKRENVLTLSEEYGVLEHETSRFSQKVQKLHLFGKELYTPTDITEYSTLLKANSLMQFSFNELPKFETTAPFWVDRIRKEMISQLSEVPVKIQIIPNREPVRVIFKLRPETDNSRFGLKCYNEIPCFHSPMQSALYWCWLASYQDFTAGLLSLKELEEHTQKVLDKLHSFLYLPPRSRTEGTRFKRLISYLLPSGGQGLQEAA